MDETPLKVETPIEPTPQQPVTKAKAKHGKGKGTKGKGVAGKADKSGNGDKPGHKKDKGKGKAAKAKTKAAPKPASAKAVFNKLKGRLQTMINSYQAATEQGRTEFPK